MTKKGLARPGALQMLVAIVSITVGSIAPTMMALRSPNHEWALALNGAPALGMFLVAAGLSVLYIIGFLRYCSSKGFSKWLAFWLLLGNVPGFIVLMLLPDLNYEHRNTSGHKELSSSKA